MKVRASRLLSALPDWGSSPRGRQAGTATTLPIIRVGNHASAVTLVGCAVDRVNYKIGLLVYKCLHGLAPGYLSDHCVPASTFAGRDNMRSFTRGWIDYCTSHEPKPKHWVHEGFITPRLPCGTRSRWTCVIPDSGSTPLEQNWNLTLSQLIYCFFRCPFMYFIL